FKVYLPTEPTGCPCRETRKHILCDCPLFTRQRIYLREVFRNLILSELMSTEEGIKALAKFTEESGAFKKDTRQRQEEDDIEMEKSR
ncbi:hypothetical protein EDB19DRAFT_1639226, partial [Suillus lakei]